MSFLREQGGVVVLSVKVQPRASSNEIGEVAGDELKVKVTAPPVDSAANEAVLRLLAEVLDCPRGSVQLVRGPASWHKVVAVHDLSAEEVARKLAAASK